MIKLQEKNTEKYLWARHPLVNIVYCVKITKIMVIPKKQHCYLRSVEICLLTNVAKQKQIDLKEPDIPKPSSTSCL